MSTLQGNAKKYNGAAIDYVLIFDWATGAYIGTANPDVSGVWRFDYFNDLHCGITYVADGCEPITHGAYNFIAENALEGYLFMLRAQSGGYFAGYDVNATSNPNWDLEFGITKDIGVFNYVYSLSKIDVQTSTPPTIINEFDINWVLSISFRNTAADRDTHTATLELLDAENNVLAAIKSETDNARSSGLWYGTSLSSMTKAAKSSTATYTSGKLKFNGGRITYTNDAPSGFNRSFVLDVDIRAAKKIRVSGSALSTFSVSGGFIKIEPPAPTQ